MSTERITPQHRAPGLLRRSLSTLSSLSPALAGRVGGDLFMRPMRRRIRPAEAEWMGKARIVWVENAGHRIAVHTWGAGPTVLLHHGWSGNAAQMTSFVGPLLDAGFSVAAVDARAHGASTGTRNNFLWMSGDAAAVVDRIGPVAFVGHSMGAVVGAWVQRERARAERLVLLAPPAELEVYTEVFAEAVGLSPRAHAAMVEHYSRRLGARFEQYTAEWMTRSDLPPALVVYDDDDTDAPPSHARRWIERWPSEIEVVRTRALGHRAVLREPSVIEAVTEFCRGAQSAG